jgi:hypothetical protein
MYKIYSKLQGRKNNEFYSFANEILLSFAGRKTIIIYCARKKNVDLKHNGAI